MDPDTCPTCLSKADEFGEREWGQYKLDGQWYDCHCEYQISLRKHYLLANIPDQYMRLSWERDFFGDPAAQDAVTLYLSKWSAFKLNGMGIEFAGKELGVGKTFAATTIGKELVKLREDVFFMPFHQMLHAMRYEEQDILDRLENVNVLILDEVLPPPNEALRSVMANHFESMIRNRTNYNGVTIMTTNMTEADMNEEYPRVYSLLSAKQMRVDLNGNDARQGMTGKRNLELIMNGEVRPIT
jgi:DNA replication protein DnaC